ncbi:MAG: flavin reductase family protein, partial [Candidatus Margulisiibacteriota bacterium]
RVTAVMKLGTHDMFLAKILAVHVERKLINNQNNLVFDKAEPICYCHGYYYALGKNLGRHGFSVRKK